MRKRALEISIIPAKQGRRVHRDLPAGKNPLSYAYHALSQATGDAALRAFLIEFQGGIREEIPLASHAGEEFLYVLEGEIEFRTPDESRTLRPGDSLHFDARIAHAFINLKRKVARALAVICED